MNHLGFVMALSSYTVFIALASLVLHKTPSAPLLCLSGVLFVLSLIVERRYPHVSKMQIILMAAFHWTSHLNWAYPLYVLLVAPRLLRTEQLTKAILIAVAYAVVYTAVVISYSAHTVKDYLLVATNIWVFAILLVFIRYILRMHVEQKTLRKENAQLAVRDPLTGLLNLQEFHRRLDSMLQPASVCVVCLVDCLNFKSMNYEQGFDQGNIILQQIASFLQTSLREADLLARYGGDKFVAALCTTNVEATLNRIQSVVHVGLKDKLNVEAIYSHVIFPHDASNKEALLSLVDASLFAVKRSTWMKREELLLHSEKLKVVGEMAAGMAHEIRNPLTTIQGLLQISAKSDYNVEPWYPLIMQEIQRMSALTGEFLQLSKPTTAQYERTSLEQLIQKVVPLMEPNAISLGHQLSVSPCPTPIWVSIDVAKMSQVILNIIKNALEAMDHPGFVRITLSSEDLYGVIEVQDTGKGMAEQEVRKLFRPFQTTKDYGTGLGLYISQAIVNTHDGHIEVASQPGVGSQFRILLPRAPAL